MAAIGETKDKLGMFGKRRQQNAKQQWKEPTATPPVTERDTTAETERKDAAPSDPKARETTSAAQGAAQPTKPSQPGASTKPASKPDPNAVLARPSVRNDPARLTTQPGKQPNQTETEESESQKLLVGRDISLSGEIQSCKRLVVEGEVDAKLSESQNLEVTESGLYKGTAIIDTADIAGRFEGDLTVRKQLVVRATGQVHGTIRYRALEIEGGGRIGGTMMELSEADIQALDNDELPADTAPTAVATPANGAGTTTEPMASEDPHPTNGLSH